MKKNNFMKGNLFFAFLCFFGILSGERLPFINRIIPRIKTIAAGFPGIDFIKEQQFFDTNKKDNVLFGLKILFLRKI